MKWLDHKACLEVCGIRSTARDVCRDAVIRSLLYQTKKLDLYPLVRNSGKVFHQGISNTRLELPKAHRCYVETLLEVKLETGGPNM